MRRRTITSAIYACLILLSSGPAPARADFIVDWWTIAGGGGDSAGGGWNLSATIGQPDAGATMSGGGWTLTGGFWPGALAAPQQGACCLSDNSCITTTAAQCGGLVGLYLGDGTTCGTCASATGIDPSQSVTLDLGGGTRDLDPLASALVTFRNDSGPPDAWVKAGRSPDNPHPGAGGYRVFGTTVEIQTNLDTGQYFMTVEIPFTQADLDRAVPPITDALSVDLYHYRAGEDTWVLAVDDPGPPGTQYVVGGCTPPVLGQMLGDYGVCWCADTGQGFAWANVDHASAFAAGTSPASPTRPGDLNCSGSVGFDDINPFVLYLSNFATWQAAYPDCPPENGDINGDGLYPDFGDINPFVAVLAGGQ
jgi:hypothetical protein